MLLELLSWRFGRHRLGQAPRQVAQLQDGGRGACRLDQSDVLLAERKHIEACAIHQGWEELDHVEMLRDRRDLPKWTQRPVGAEEIWRGIHGQPLLLVSPEDAVIDQRVGRAHDVLDLGLAEVARIELVLHLADQVLEPDGILPDLRPRVMGRHQDGHRGTELERGELVDRFSADGHRPAPFLARRPRREPESSQAGRRMPGLLTICTVLACGPLSPSDSSKRTSVPTASRSKASCSTL